MVRMSLAQSVSGACTGGLALLWGGYGFGVSFIGMLPWLQVVPSPGVVLDQREKPPAPLVERDD